MGQVVALCWAASLLGARTPRLTLIGVMAARLNLSSAPPHQLPPLVKSILRFRTMRYRFSCNSNLIEAPLTQVAFRHTLQEANDPTALVALYPNVANRSSA